MRCLRALQLLLKKCARALVDLDQAAALLRLPRLFRRGVRDFRHRDAELLGHHAHGLGEGDVLDLLHEAEDIASGIAAEAVEELVAGVHRKRRRLFLVEGTQPLVILRAALAQLDVLADDADDVGLLLDGAGEIAGIGHEN